MNKWNKWGQIQLISDPIFLFFFQGRIMHIRPRNLLLTCALVVFAFPLTVWAEAVGFDALKYNPVKTLPLEGKTVRRLSDGDTLHPTFSPDGRYLAFTRVIDQGNTELTEAGYLNLETGKTIILLDAETSKQYAVYSSFIYRIKWISNTRIEFWVSDGDVDTSVLTYDITQNKEIAQRYVGMEEDLPTKEHEAVAIQFAAAFPDIKPHLSGMLQQGTHVPPDKWVFQKNYAKQDDHVWLIDRKNNTHRVLLELPDKGVSTFRSAIARGNAFLLVVGFQNMVSLVLVDKKGARIIDRFATENHQQVHAKQLGNESNVFFVVQTGHVRTRNPAHLYHWDKHGIRKLDTGPDFIEADVSKDGKKMALVSWQGDKRVVRVIDTTRK